MFDNRIDRYLADDMTAEERAHLERELTGSSELRAQLEEAREVLALAGEWFEAPAPGAERAAELRVPPLAPQHTARVVPLRRVAGWAVRAAAVAAVFFAGYVARGAGENSVNPPVRDRIEVPDTSTTHVEVAPPANDAQPPATTAPPRVERTIQTADASNYRRVIDNGGELIIETPRSYWVVDPGFDFKSTLTSGEVQP